MTPMFLTKRIYEPVAPDDGQRILVDRIWPRGISHERAALDAWIPDVAPSKELRQWFAHDPERWAAFQVRYRAELDGNPHLEELRALGRHGTVTLLYAARNREQNEAVVLAAMLNQR
ncbi:MAG TPA: DUF488 domain-containing protein [Acidimicrobiia bacterium]|jgi:uncharacterized protein YeaO (DUF488 family)|nr:DUF488 domain-containing protein [Acidimicrobiia bacterium]